MVFTFQRCCALLAARNLYLAGVTVREIAQQAGKSPTTIRRWLKVTGAVK